MPGRLRARGHVRASQKQVKNLTPDLNLKTSTRVTQAQSLELAKTFIHSSVRAQICYMTGIITDYSDWLNHLLEVGIVGFDLEIQNNLETHRDLFPIDCYDECQYDPNDGVIPYNEFINQTKPSARQKPTKTGHVFRTIKREKDKKVNVFLDILENGVFRVLEDGYLRALDLLIVRRMELPLEVLEKYTFYFHQNDDGLHTITAPGIDKTPFTLDTIKHDMRSVIKRIIELDRTLPRLPNERFLHVQVHYNDKAPDNYDPPGFRPARDTIYKVQNDRGWKMIDTEFGHVRTEEHEIELVGSILEHENCSIASVPSDIRFDPAPNEINRIPRLVTNNGTAGVVKKDISIRILPNSINQQPALLQGSNKVDNLQNRATPDDELAQQKLRQLDISQEISNDKIETQPITQKTQFSNDKFTQRFESRQPLRLSNVLIQKLNAHRRPLIDGQAPSQRETISCQCHWNHDEGDLMQCQYCGCWQHILCNGYIDNNDPSIPIVYACTQCLLDVSDQPATEDLHNLSLLRNALQIVLTIGYRSDDDFRAVLHCTAEEAEAVAAKLFAEGILNLNHRKKLPSGSHRTYCVRQTKPRLSQCLNKYFDPSKGIESLFGDNLGGRTTKTQASSSVKIFASPAIEDLDLDSQPLITKRNLKRQGDGDDEPQAKRYRVSQSQTMINVTLRSST